MALEKFPSSYMDVTNLKLRAKMKYEKILSLFLVSLYGNVLFSRNSTVKTMDVLNFTIFGDFLNDLTHFFATF